MRTRSALAKPKLAKGVGGGPCFQADQGLLLEITRDYGLSLARGASFLLLSLRSFDAFQKITSDTILYKSKTNFGPWVISV